MNADTGADELVFKRVDLDTGEYLTPPVPVGELAENIRSEQPGGPHANELRRRHQDDEAHYGVIYGRDPEDIGKAA
jgi:hypothetical protein